MDFQRNCWGGLRSSLASRDPARPLGHPRRYQVINNPLVPPPLSISDPLCNPLELKRVWSSTSYLIDRDLDCCMLGETEVVDVSLQWTYDICPLITTILVHIGSLITTSYTEDQLLSSSLYISQVRAIASLVVP